MPKSDDLKGILYSSTDSENLYFISKNSSGWRKLEKS